MKLFLSIITSTVVIATVFTMVQWWDMRQSIEQTNEQEIRLLEEQNAMIQDAMKKGIVVIQHFGETKIIDGGVE